MTSGINNLVLNKKATQQRIQLRRKFAFLALDLTLEIWDSVMCWKISVMGFRVGFVRQLGEGKVVKLRLDHEHVKPTQCDRIA